MKDELLKEIKYEVSLGLEFFNNHYERHIIPPKFLISEEKLENIRRNRLGEERKRLISDAYYRILRTRKNEIIEDTNNIFVCGCTRVYWKKLPSGRDYWLWILEEDIEKYDKNLIRKSYINIESRSIIKLSFDKSIEFEKNNICLRCDFEEACYEFLDIALKVDQKTAVKELVKKYSIKK